MAYNYRYENNKENGFGGQGMTDIPNIRSKINYSKPQIADDTRSVSPPKFDTGKNSEVFSSDLVKKNEEKVRENIIFANNSGTIGPYLKFDKNSPSPKAPKMAVGVSSYKTHFSPQKKREPTKLALNDSYSSTLNNTNASHGIRHMTNGDAMYRRAPMSNSIDFSAPSNNRVKYARNMALDKTGEMRSRILKSNADRILDNPSGPHQSPNIHDSSKFEELRKETQSYRREENFPKPDLMKYNTVDSTPSQENFNSDNILKNSPSKAPQPAGTYNAAHLKRTMGLSPTDSVNFAPSLAQRGSPVVHGEKKINSIGSMPNLNDPSYHRHKNFNNYGFDAITGVRKTGAYREL